MRPKRHAQSRTIHDLMTKGRQPIGIAGLWRGTAFPGRPLITDGLGKPSYEGIRAHSLQPVTSAELAASDCSQGAAADAKLAAGPELADLSADLTETTDAA